MRFLAFAKGRSLISQRCLLLGYVKIPFRIKHTREQVWALARRSCEVTPRKKLQYCLRNGLCVGAVKIAFRIKIGNYILNFFPCSTVPS